MRALLLINCASREGEANAQDARDQLTALGVDVIMADCKRPQELPKAIDAQCKNVDLIVLGGGDVTLNLAAGAVMRSGLPLGVLPLGTANDFARTLLIPEDIEAACRNAVEGVPHRIDLGQCNEVYFANVASIGLAVRAQEYRSDAAKRWFGALGYANNVFSAFRDTKPFDAEIAFDGQGHTLRSIQIAVGNGRYFGGGLPVADDAALDDGRLDLYSLEPQGFWSLVGKLPALVRGPDQTVQGLQMFEAIEFRVTTRRPMPINTDGEVLAETPATFRVLPKALTVKVPRAYIERYGRHPAGAVA